MSTAEHEEEDFDAWHCQDCDGRGWNWKWHQVGELKSDQQEFQTECDTCRGLGIAGPDAEAKAASKDKDSQ